MNETTKFENTDIMSIYQKSENILSVFSVFMGSFIIFLYSVSLSSI